MGLIQLISLPICKFKTLSSHQENLCGWRATWRQSTQIGNMENPTMCQNTKSVFLILVCLFGWMTAVLTINRGGNTYIERCLVALLNAVACRL